MVRRKPNLFLLDLLKEARWDHESFAHAINRQFDRRLVAPETAREWVHYGRCPHGDMPHIAVHVLENRLGRTLDPDAVWDRPLIRQTSTVDPFSFAKDVHFDMKGAVQLINKWGDEDISFNPHKQRSFIPNWTPLATAATVSCLDTPSSSHMVPFDIQDGVDVIPSEALDVVDTMIDHLRRMDDAVGGSEGNLHVVHQEFTAVGKLVKYGDASDARVRQRLLTAHAQLSHLAGWMAHDFERQGLGQKYYLTALHSAHAANNRELLAYIFRSMSYQAVYCHQGKAALTYAEAAREASADASLSVRALAASQHAMAQALSGSEYSFRKYAEEARGLLTGASNDEREMSLIYWLNDDTLDVLFGYSLLLLTEVAPRKKQALLAEADKHMASYASDNVTWPRDAMYYTSWRARGLLACHENDEAMRLGRIVLSWLQDGRPNQRSITQIRKLEATVQAQAALRHHAPTREFRQYVKEVLSYE